MCDEKIKALMDQLPDGWTLGPTHCPIGLDRSPMLCSAGCCIACRWIEVHWDRDPIVRLRKDASLNRDKP